MQYYNCHTHIFDFPCVPDKAYGKSLAPLKNLLDTSERFNNWVLLRLLPYIVPAFTKLTKEEIQRYIDFFKISKMGNQRDIMRHLIKLYKDNGYPEMRFVVLPMDMEYMGADTSDKSYPTQLRELIEMKSLEEFASYMYVFFHVHPDRFTSATDIANDAVMFIEKYGFNGIKMYPALGFFPQDRKLDKLYKFAEDRQIPIMVHVAEGPVHWRGSFDKIAKSPYYTKEVKAYGHKTDKNVNFQSYLTDPRNYIDVLTRFPKLKICFAHMGAASRVLKRDEDIWVKTILDLMGKYENVYTDVSHTLYNTKTHTFIKELLNSKTEGKLKFKPSDKILFGTDFYVTTPNKIETDLMWQLRKEIGEEAFTKIASLNAESYLKTEYKSNTKPYKVV